MFILGLTGNIGCGKSTVADMLKEFGYYHVDADVLTKDIYTQRADELYDVMLEEFGEEIFDENKIVDKKKLGPIVFGDDKKLNKLNSIMHPIISNMINERMILAMETGIEKVILDAALLFEGGLNLMADKVLVITCDELIQKERIKKRDLLSDKESLRRIRSQMPQDKKVYLSDYAIDNSSTVDKLRKEVEDLINRIEKSDEFIKLTTK